MRLGVSALADFGGRAAGPQRAVVCAFVDGLGETILLERLVAGPWRIIRKASYSAKPRVMPVAEPDLVTHAGVAEAVAGRVSVAMPMRAVGRVAILGRYATFGWLATLVFGSPVAAARRTMQGVGDHAKAVRLLSALRGGYIGT